MPDKGKKGKKPRKDKDKRKGDKKHKQGKDAAKVSGSAALLETGELANKKPHPRIRGSIPQVSLRTKKLIRASAAISSTDDPANQKNKSPNLKVNN